MDSVQRVSKIVERCEHVSALAHRLESMSGLAENDRMGLRICAEILHRALSSLSVKNPLSDSQAMHLLHPGEQLLLVADALAHNSTPVQVADWWRMLEPKARDFSRAVDDLPHR